MTKTEASGGFTLVEMLVVLGLVALLLAVSLPYSTSSGEARKLDAVAQIIAAKLRDTQSAAISSNGERLITLDLKKKLVIQTKPDRSLEIPVALNLSVVTAQNEALLDRAAIRFFPDGGSTGGTIILSKDDLRREIAINWLTGAVVVSTGELP